LAPFILKLRKVNVPDATLIIVVVIVAENSIRILTFRHGTQRGKKLVSLPGDLQFDFQATDKEVTFFS
jgi:hypothetical protein